MTEAFLRLPPVKSRCREVRNQDQNSTGSPWLSMVNRFWLACITPCMNSCGLTCSQTEALGTSGVFLLVQPRVNTSPPGRSGKGCLPIYCSLLSGWPASRPA